MVDCMFVIVNNTFSWLPFAGKVKVTQWHAKDRRGLTRRFKVEHNSVNSTRQAQTAAQSRIARRLQLRSKLHNPAPKQ